MDHTSFIDGSKSIRVGILGTNDSILDSSLT
ncbi:hypothetical protein SAMN05421832_109142 [Psychrobacillus psychrodurans]|nr:hypothetical protein SAMN05421832_109142 [Psychrobacillus psychrodurans]